jgi:dolichol-phosphate mannosyltransferase
MQSRKSELSVIIPCYNEADHIQRVLDAVKNGGDFVKEIIVVDDCSSDHTRDILGQYSGDDQIVVHLMECNSGKGAAIRAGLEYVTREIVIIQDADLEYDPKEYSSVIRPIIEGSTNVVYGSRFKGSITGMRVQNRIANYLLTWTANMLYGAHISDEATCYKAFRTDVIKNLPLKCMRFEFCPEVTAKLLKRKIAIEEVPITYSGRTIADGKKISWKDAFEAIWTLIKYRFID